MTKNEIQELYKLSSDYNKKMLWVCIKNLFRKKNIAEPHWLNDVNWYGLLYEED